MATLQGSWPSEIVYSGHMNSDIFLSHPFSSHSSFTTTSPTSLVLPHYKMGDHSQTGSTYSNSRYDGNDKRRQKIPFDPTKFAQAQQSAAGSAARSVPASFGGGTGGSVAGSDATGFSQPQSSRGLPSGFSTLSKADQGKSGYPRDILLN
jgi:hypothetical protein